MESSLVSFIVALALSALPLLAGNSIFSAVQLGDFAENGFDRRLVEDCFRQQDQWQSDLSSHCHEIAQGTTLPTPRLVHRYRLYQHLVEQDAQDQRKVTECLLRAAIDFEVPQSSECQGLTLKSLVNSEGESTLRQARIALHLKQTREDLDIAQSCLYDTDWHADSTHHCYQLVALPNQLVAGLSGRQQRQKALYEALLEQDDKDRSLVQHCVQYHLFDVYRPCRVITEISRARQTSERRQARIASLHADLYKSKAAFEVDSDVQLVLSCLYDTTWTANSEHICHSIARGEPNIQMEPWTLERLHRLFTELKMKNLVTDCFDHHRDDQLPACFGVSWSLQESSSKGSLPHLEVHRKIWNNLLRLEKCRTHPRCLK